MVDDERLVGRTGMIPVPLEVPVEGVVDIVDVVVVVDVGCKDEVEMIEEAVEEVVGVCVKVDIVTMVVSCVDEAMIEIVNT